MTTTASHILVAEDNSALATVVRFNLVQAGYEVTVARNGREALEQARKRPFDLVITDHQMPELTGVELCRQLRQDDAYRQTPLILLTAKALELDPSGLHHGVQISALVGKPFSPAELVQKVRNLLQVNRTPC